MPMPWERNWSAAQPAAPAQSAPAAPGYNGWNDPAYLAQVYDWQRRSGQNAAAAQTYNHLLDLQADTQHGLIRDPVTGQMVVMPGYNEGRASTVRAEAEAREGVQDRFARDRKAAENEFTREGQMNEATDKFNKDWTTSKIFNDYRKASQYRGAAQDALGRIKTDQSGAAAMQLLVSYVKSYDPDSVVNDGEREVIVSTASLPESAQGMVQNVLSGGKMTYEQGQRIMKELDGNFQGLQEQYELVRGGQSAYLKSRGVKDVDVVLTPVGKRFDVYKTEAEVEAEKQAAEAQKVMQAPQAAPVVPAPAAPAAPAQPAAPAPQMIEPANPMRAEPPKMGGMFGNLSSGNQPAPAPAPAGDLPTLSMEEVKRLHAAGQAPKQFILKETGQRVNRTQ